MHDMASIKELAAVASSSLLSITVNRRLYCQLISAFVH